MDGFTNNRQIHTQVKMEHFRKMEAKYIQVDHRQRALKHPSGELHFSLFNLVSRPRHLKQSASNYVLKLIPGNWNLRPLPGRKFSIPSSGTPPKQSDVLCTDFVTKWSLNAHSLTHAELSNVNTKTFLSCICFNNTNKIYCE